MLKLMLAILAVMAAGTLAQAAPAAPPSQSNYCESAAFEQEHLAVEDKLTAGGGKMPEEEIQKIYSACKPGDIIGITTNRLSGDADIARMCDFTKAVIQVSGRSPKMMCVLAPLRPTR